MLLMIDFLIVWFSKSNLYKNFISGCLLRTFVFALTHGTHGTHVTHEYPDYS
ncbi:2342_t:CDS:2 [Entrophospora sp. SA101]|nr:2342_t:CDS:2 [Entrophospora sp. SA101]